MDYYDSGKMRSGAADIRSEMKTYTTAKEDIDNIVTTLRNNWKDDTNTKYSQKYNTEAKVSAENVASLMEQFAQALESAAETLEALHRKAQENMG
ncbi:MAG: WXG100 family type VII secretion target [Clostridiales bacterium]|nr:WXG100 family type VII secretion target [Clostridiales bacterium]